MVLCQDAGDVSRVEGHIRSPLAKAAMPVDGLDPLGKEFTLGLVLLRVLTLDLKHKHLVRVLPVHILVQRIGLAPAFRCRIQKP